MILPFEPSPAAPTTGRSAAGADSAHPPRAAQGAPASVAELCALLATRTGATRERRLPLPAALTLAAPGALPYATLVAALAAARRTGVRQARVVVTM
jgi:hypothetical protein